MSKLNFFAGLIFIAALFFGVYTFCLPKKIQSIPIRKKVCVNPEAVPSIPRPDTVLPTPPQLGKY